MKTREKFLGGLEPGSAAYVVAHAEMQRAKGKNPSEPFLHVRNPRKALDLAMISLVQAAHKQLVAEVSARIFRGKTWRQITDDEELRLALRFIIEDSSSKDEAFMRIKGEFQYPYELNLSVSTIDDTPGRQARELVKMLGGLVMRDGSLARGLFWGKHGTILSL